MFWKATTFTVCIKYLNDAPGRGVFKTLSNIYDIAFANVLHGPKYDLTFPSEVFIKSYSELTVLQNHLKITKKTPKTEPSYNTKLLTATVFTKPLLTVVNSPM